MRVYSVTISINFFTIVGCRLGGVYETQHQLVISHWSLVIGHWSLENKGQKRRLGGVHETQHQLVFKIPPNPPLKGGKVEVTKLNIKALRYSLASIGSVKASSKSFL